MVTQKQLIANWESAKKGCPKTDEGKAILRLNAMKRGLLCKVSALYIEKRRQLNDLLERVVTDVQPVGELEMMLLDRLVSSYWRLRRVLELEKNFLNGLTVGEDCDFWVRHDDEGLGKWQNLNRYEAVLEKQFYKALHELQRLQMARGRVRPPGPIAIDVEASVET